MFLQKSLNGKMVVSNSPINPLLIYYLYDMCDGLVNRKWGSPPNAICLPTPQSFSILLSEKRAWQNLYSVEKLLDKLASFLVDEVSKLDGVTFCHEMIRIL